jgi:lysophospholipase L1-like esterase
VLALICVEVSLRVFFPSISELVFTEDVTGGHSITKNEFGLRDDDFPREKPPGEKRILALGNSTTFGSGVAQEDTYPQQWERILGARYQVINGGGQGGSMDALIEFLQEDGLSFQPDLVTLGFSPSMIVKTKMGGKKSFFSHALKLAQNSYAWVAFDFYVRKNFYRLGILQDDLSKPRGASYAYAFDVKGVDLEAVERDYAAFFEKLKTLKSILDERGIPLLIVGLPSRFELARKGENNPRQYPLDKIRIQPLDRMSEYATQLDMPYFDLRPALMDQNDIYIRTDYAHLNKEGLRIVAEELNRISK